MHKLEELQKRVSEAQARYDRLKIQHRLLVEREVAAKGVLEAASSDELKGAFDKEFTNSANELIDRFRELERMDLWIIPQRQEDIDAANWKLAILQNQVSDAEARYDRAKRLDSIRQATLQRTAAVLSELAQPEIRGKLGNDGLALIASLTKYQDTLSSFDIVRLINRPDYSDALSSY